MSGDKIKDIEIPQDNGDKKLSEQEKMAWIRFSTQELSDDVLRSLRININGVSKYIKDVVYYNNDIKEILDNPEEVIKLQAFLKKKINSDIDLTGIYDKKTEIAVNEYRKNRNIEGEMAFFQKQNPAFTGLIQKYPTRFEEIKKRATLYNELEKMKGEVSYLAKDKEGKNITTIQQALISNLDNANIFNSSTVSTYIEGWNGPGSINYVWFGSHDITYTEYIRRLLNKNGLIKELFGNVQKSQEQILDKSQKEQLSRAKIFMDSLIVRNPSLNMDNKKEVDAIYAMIIVGDTKVIDVLNKLTKNKLDLTVNLSTKEGLANALRAIGDTATAGSIMHSELNTKLVDMTDTGDTNPEALTRFNNAYIENQSRLSGDKYKNIIQKKIDNILASISDDPTSEYYYLIGDTKKQQQMKEGLMALMIFDETMKQTGPEGLGDLAAIYDDMKGLNGIFNFTDENVKMTKEIAIMLASIALTAGLSTVLSVAGAGLRAAQVARVAKAVDSANKATKLAKIGAGLNGVTGRMAGGGARIFEVSAQTINKINSIPVIGNALVFTAVETGFRKYYHSEGEMVTGLEDFGRSLTANTAMFGVFHGVGKLTGKLITKFGVQGAFKQFGILSVGDVGGMYFLHLVETEKLTLTKEEFATLCAQVVGFRGLMKGMEKVYPKLSARIKTYSEKQNIVAEGAGKQEMKAITADAGKSRTIDSKSVSNGNLESLKSEYEQIEKQIKIKQEARKQNYGTNTPEANKSSYDEIRELRRKGREIKAEIRKIEGVNKTTEVEQNQKSILDSKNNGAQKEVEKIEKELLELQKTKKEQEIELNNRKAGYERVKSDSPQQIERLKRLEQAVKDQEIRLLETEASIKEKEGKLMKLADEKTHIGKTEPEIIVEKTAQDIRINEYQKKIEQVDERLRTLNNAKINIEAELNGARDTLKTVKANKGMDKKIKKERIKEIKETIKSLKKEVKKLDKEIKKTIKEKEVLVEEKNREIQLGDYVEISEKAGKSTRQSVKDWLKQNPKKAIIGTILAVGGVGGVTYYILQKDSLGDTVPVIYIPDEDEDKNYKQDGQPKIPDEGESSEGQEGKQGGSTEGDSKGATSVVPSSPNKGGESYKGSNKNLVERPDAAGKSGAQSAGAKTRVGSSTNATGDSKPEGIQTAVNLQEQIKAKQVNLLGDLQNIYKNRYQNLKDIGLGDAFFGLDKGVELDENPIYLDYDGTINGKIIVNSKGEYQITLDNKKAIAGYTANAIITGNDLFEILTKGFTIGKEIDKAELKAYRAFVEKEEEKRRMYGA